MSCPNVLIGHPVLAMDSRQRHAGMTGTFNVMLECSYGSSGIGHGFPPNACGNDGGF